RLGRAPRRRRLGGRGRLPPRLGAGAPLVPVGEPGGGHRAPDPAAHHDHRRLDPRRARAVAVAPPPVEDAAGAGAVTAPERLLVRAPNWLGDAGLSLPARRDLARSCPRSRIELLARAWVAPLYGAVGEVDAVRESRGVRADAEAVRGAFDAAVLLPNSFASALAVWRADIPERWGYATDLRGALLTRRPRVPP